MKPLGFCPFLFSKVFFFLLLFLTLRVLVCCPVEAFSIALFCNDAELIIALDDEFVFLVVYWKELGNFS